jgi:hypothetical protein
MIARVTATAIPGAVVLAITDPLWSAGQVFDLISTPSTVDGALILARAFLENTCFATGLCMSISQR